MNRLPLSYRIIRGRPTTFNTEEKQRRTWLMEMAKEESNQLKTNKSVSFVNVSSVAEYYYSSGQQSWEKKDFPKVLLPFKNCFLEWDCPKHYNDGKSVSLVDNNVQSGLFCHTIDLENPKEKTLFEFLTSCKRPPYGDLCDALWFTKAVNSSRFFCAAHVWLASSETNGEAFYPGLYLLTFSNERGEEIESQFLSYGSTSEADIRGLADNGFHIMHLAASFMHCKNIEVKNTDSEVYKKWSKRQKLPYLTLKTLDIDPMKKILKTEGRSESVGNKKALHICRGHFSTYTEKAPLFGKVTGTFWVPQHTRGSKEFGEVEKDYRVKGETI